MTCGWFNGDQASPALCFSGATCASNVAYSQYGCCANPNGCYLFTGCIPYISLSACDEACENNIQIAKCVSTAAPYCVTNTVTSPNILYGVGCTDVADADRIIDLTYSGEFATLNSNGSNAGTLTDLPTFASVSEASGGQPSQTTASGSNSSSSNTDSSSSPSALSPGTLAAIAVPSAIGGLAFLALLAWLIIWLRRRNRRPHRDAHYPTAAAALLSRQRSREQRILQRPQLAPVAL